MGTHRNISFDEVCCTAIGEPDGQHAIPRNRARPVIKLLEEDFAGGEGAVSAQAPFTASCRCAVRTAAAT
jgi:hypothetical protein